MRRIDWGGGSRNGGHQLADSREGPGSGWD